MKKEKLLIFLLIAVCGCSFVGAQDFGFGFDDTETVSSKPSVPVKIGGEIAVELSPYVHDFKKEGTQAISFWDMFSGSLDFTLSGSNIEAFAAFNLNADSISELWNADEMLSDPTYTPLIMDEAFLRAYIGPVNIEAGLRKLSWGKADIPGPLDVTNPMDYTDLRYISDIMGCKIAQPMLHVTWNTGDFSKLEGVFIPNFAGHRFAEDGRWAPSQYANMYSTAEKGILDRAIELNPALAMLVQAMYPQAAGSFSGISIEYPDTGKLENFQAGLRYTTTIGSIDIGGQYFYGKLFRPSFTIGGVDEFIADLISSNMPPDPGNFIVNTSLLEPQIKYNRYHQIGIDYAQVLFGFNVRAEAAIHLTEDLAGDDGSVQNPFIGWSIGFDRHLFMGINANVQCNETIRLLNNKIGSNPILDAEADTDATATRLTMQLSKKFLRDNLESKATVIWDIENSDCYIIPALVWTAGNMTSELSAGIFAGKESGELGQYWENSFIMLAVKYQF